MSCFLILWKSDNFCCQGGNSHGLGRVAKSSVLQRWNIILTHYLTPASSMNVQNKEREKLQIITCTSIGFCTRYAKITFHHNFFPTFLIRTLGDVLCDNSAMDGTQKWELLIILIKLTFHWSCFADVIFSFPRWVTLQPDADYNPREKCKDKRRLDLEGITKEIVDEISDNRRWGQKKLTFSFLSF